MPRHPKFKESAAVLAAVAAAAAAEAQPTPPPDMFPPWANTVNSAAPFYIDLTGLDFRTTPPTRDPRHPRYPAATDLPDGQLPSRTALGNFIIGPTHAAAPEAVERPGVARGRIVTFAMSSADSVIYRPGVVREEAAPHAAIKAASSVPGDPSNLALTKSRAGSWTRTVSVYVPAGYRPAAQAPFLVVGDGEAIVAAGLPIRTVLDNLIADSRIPPLVAILIGSGGQDAQGSQRGREYDAVSGVYAQWVESEVLPKVEREAGVRLTRDPDGRAAMGFSSSGAAAFSMAWFRPDLYRRVLAYSPTFVNQQWPHDPALPGGAWEYHSVWTGPSAPPLAVEGFQGIVPAAADTVDGSPLLAHSERKPIRFWFLVGDRDMFYTTPALSDGMHDWVLANERMASALAAKGYSYQFIFARNSAHVDLPTLMQTLPAALEWVWADFRAPRRP